VWREVAGRPAGNTGGQRVLDALIVVLLVLVLLGIVAVGVLFLRRNRGQSAEAVTAAPVDPLGSADVDAVRGDPRALAPGAVVDIRNQTYSVRGTLRLSEDGWSWTEHLLDNAAGRKVWLSVEEDPDLEMVLYTEIPDAAVQPGRSIELDGRTYHRKESGTARFRAEGTTGLDREGTLRYEDYAADDDSRLALEAYGDGGRWEVSRGEVLSRYEVMIYPATD
jgi:hypothetical protein